MPDVTPAPVVLHTQSRWEPRSGVMMFAVVATAEAAMVVSGPSSIR
ncbi:hypothetical protein [Amycolatopsis speibonae]|uniref:Uncharacterized protein n=1 Tax=Amycolatopsis speibonae TaxID=1450224 RepID=A0ABV7NNP7_9PSEU